MEGPWTPRHVSASGQVFEFRLWALLTEQSRGSLHVFLPVTDRGVDALVHRISDGKYFEIQAKSRSTLIGGEVHLVAWVLPIRLVAEKAWLLVGSNASTWTIAREMDFK